MLNVSVPIDQVLGVDRTQQAVAALVICQFKSPSFSLVVYYSKERRIAFSKAKDKNVFKAMMAHKNMEKSTDLRNTTRDGDISET
jgi:hypothetical protein